LVWINLEQASVRSDCATLCDMKKLTQRPTISAEAKLAFRLQDPQHRLRFLPRIKGRFASAAAHQFAAFRL
jgi:hypothetical protein